MSTRVPDVGSSRLMLEFDQVQQRLKEVESRYPGYRLALSGMPVLSTYGAQGMIPALIRCLALDAPILILMFVMLRSIRLALVSLVPNILPLIVAAAGMALLDVPLRYSVVMCFTICLGIAVDDTIHIMVLYRRELRRDGDSTGAVLRAMRSMVPVIITTNTLIMIGFGVAMLSSMPTLRLFGGIACVILVLAILADLFLLPVLVCATAPRRLNAQAAEAPPTTTHRDELVTS